MFGPIRSIVWLCSTFVVTCPLFWLKLLASQMVCHLWQQSPRTLAFLCQQKINKKRKTSCGRWLISKCMSGSKRLISESVLHSNLHVPSFLPSKNSWEAFYCIRQSHILLHGPWIVMLSDHDWKLLSETDGLPISRRSCRCYSIRTCQWISGECEFIFFVHTHQRAKHHHSNDSINSGVLKSIKQLVRSVSFITTQSSKGNNENLGIHGVVEVPTVITACKKIWVRFNRSWEWTSMRFWTVEKSSITYPPLAMSYNKNRRTSSGVQRNSRGRHDCSNTDLLLQEVPLSC